MPTNTVSRSTSLKTLSISLFLSLSLIGLPSQAAKRGITIESLASNQTTVSHSAQYRALIIGNNHYTDPKALWKPLETAISGARAVSNALSTIYSFKDVTLLENATRREILIALQKLTQRVNEGDNVLVYYAGHGYVDSVTQRGYWIPSDAIGLDHTTFLRNSTIRDELSTIANRARHTLLISDSCFSGTLLRSATRGVLPSEANETYYKKVDQKKSVQIIAAGGNEFVDDNYKKSGHSPFTYFLLNELLLNNKPLITASELSASVEKAVANNVAQVPESGVLQGAGDELGEFIFLRLNINIDVNGANRENMNVDVELVPQNKTQPLPQNQIPRSKPKSKAIENKREKQRYIPLPTL